MSEDLKQKIAAALVKADEVHAERSRQYEQERLRADAQMAARIDTFLDTVPNIIYDSRLKSPRLSEIPIYQVLSSEYEIRLGKPILENRSFAVALFRRLTQLGIILKLDYVERSNHDDPMNHYLERICTIKVIL